MKKEKLKILIALHILLVVYSTSGILSKLASQQDFFSMQFVLCYGGILVLLGLYAVGWQQIIKRLPLTTAFANRAITVVWGIVWGVIFFGESVTVLKIVGTAFVIGGVILYARADNEEQCDG